MYSKRLKLKGNIYMADVQSYCVSVNFWWIDDDDVINKIKKLEEHVGNSYLYNSTYTVRSKST